jgi:hypothetical protein
MIRIGLISYQVGHLCTLELARRISARGAPATIFAFPFTLREHKLTGFQDRPNQILDFDPQPFFQQHRISYQVIDGWSDHHALEFQKYADKIDVFIICIGKIIPQSFLKGQTFVNAHPGLLPQNRGVDAFKWSIYNKWPIGVTLHIVNEQIDAGQILRLQRVPIYPTDTLKDVAYRSYCIEGDLLVDVEQWIGKAKSNWRVDPDAYPLSHHRLSRDDNLTIETFFLKNRKHFIKLSTDPSVFPFSE